MTVDDDRLFGDMSKPEHAYALGFVAAGGRMKNDTLEIGLRGNGQPLLWLLEARSASDVPTFFDVDRRRVRLFAPLGEVAASYLHAPPGERMRQRFPDLAEDMRPAFVRGLLDATGRINRPDSAELRVEFSQPPNAFADELLSFLGTRPQKRGRSSVVFKGPAALDVLGLLYDQFDASAVEGSDRPTAPPPLCRRKHLRRYRRWCQRMALLQPDRSCFAPLRFQKLRPDAIVPHKQRVSDSGYDLTLLDAKKHVGQVVLFGTGIMAEPPQGWYFDVVARSSIIKTGYMLANNVGVIDRGYRGEILVPLLKVDPSAPDIELPARVAQLIPRPVAHFPVEVVPSLSATHRGEGGFGSSGSRLVVDAKRSEPAQPLPTLGRPSRLNQAESAASENGRE